MPTRQQLGLVMVTIALACMLGSGFMLWSAAQARQDLFATAIALPHPTAAQVAALDAADNQIVGRGAAIGWIAVGLGLLITGIVMMWSTNRSAKPKAARTLLMDN